MSSTPVVNFEYHKIRAGNIAGARDDFEKMVIDLVSITNPGAFGVQANPGDWGIDVLVGELDGDIAVWQSKYFIEGYGASQRSQVQEAFRRVQEEAKKQGFAVKYWTLCVPVALPPDELRLWQKWKRAKEKEFDMTIELWDENGLRQRLISPDAEGVLAHYYQTLHPGRMPREALDILDMPDDISYEHALFIAQLRHNGHSQLRSSQRQFFNADLMTRDIQSKAVPAELSALREARETVDAIWSERFDHACGTCDTRRLPAALLMVMDAIRANAKSFPVSLPARIPHLQGLVHLQVEAGDAGWARDWETLRDQHRLTTC